MQNKKYWHSNGKLLISGEYLVMKGATALAVPVNKGQSLEITEQIGDGTIKWAANHINGKWFEAEFNIADLKNNIENESAKQQKLIQIIKSALELNPDFLNYETNYQVITNLEFLPEHGMGSSSTLINNLAQWAECDPYKLLEKTFGGSGYDIACANSNHPIFFKRENNEIIVSEAGFHPAFAENLFFVYLGNKQKSSESIAKFNNTAKFTDYELNRISEISVLLSQTDSQSEFNELMDEHEEIMSQILKIKTVKTKLFNDFKGSVKSLGAWGGDFVMLCSILSNVEIEKYLLKKGYNTYYSFNELLVL